MTVLLRFAFTFSILCVFSYYVLFTFSFFFSIIYWLKSFRIHLLLLWLFICLSFRWDANEHFDRRWKTAPTKNELFYIVVRQTHILYGGWLPFAYGGRMCAYNVQMYAIISKLFQLNTQRKTHLFDANFAVVFSLSFNFPHSFFFSIIFFFTSFFYSIDGAAVVIISRFQLLTQLAALVSNIFSF